MAPCKQFTFEHNEQLLRREIEAFNLGDIPQGNLTDNYFKAIIRAVLDNRMDLRMVDPSSSLSSSQRTIGTMMKEKKAKKPSAKMKEAIALIIVVEFGLVAMRPYIMKLLDISPKGMEDFMDTWKRARSLGVDDILNNKK
jgi:hypothetical protein